MLSQYTNLFFPICSLAIAILVFILFFSKKQFKNIETQTYAKLVFIGLFEALLYTFICLIANLYYSSETYYIFVILNKLLYTVYILWFTILSFYVISLSKFKKEKLLKTILIVVDVIIIGLILINEVKIFYDPSNGSSNSYGPSSNVLFLGIGIYIILMLIFSLLGLKRSISKKKYIPLFLLFALMVIALIIRQIDPLFSIYSNVLSLVTLVMYFTIENPDLKFIEELAKNRELIEKSIEDKSNLLFEISQEVRVPLRKIKDLSEEAIGSSDINRIKYNLQEIYNESKESSLIVDNVLDISNVYTKKIETKNKTYNPVSLIKETIMRVSGNLSKNTSLNTVVSDSIPNELYGDSIKLKQIFVSILENAVKYTPQGTITITANCITKYDICRLIVSVEDTGVGMSIEQINNILNSDHEMNSEEINKNLEKLHLNLKLINEIVKNDGGSLLIKSQINKGTKVTIIFDQIIKSEDFKETHILTNIADSYLKKEKIILVNDKTKDIKRIKSVLKNHDIATTMYGKDLIYRVKNGEKFSLILLDDEMKPDSGYATLMELKKIKGFKTPVIVLLNKDKESIKEHYIKDGFADYILLNNLNEEIKKIEKY